MRKAFGYLALRIGTRSESMVQPGGDVFAQIAARSGKRIA
jgi:hypothetical protein